MQKIKLARARREKRAKLLFSIIIYVNFVTFLPPPSSNLLKLLNGFSGPLASLTKTGTKCNTRSRQKASAHNVDQQENILERMRGIFLPRHATSCLSTHSLSTSLESLVCDMLSLSFSFSFSVIFVFESHSYLKSEIFIV